MYPTRLIDSGKRLWIHENRWKIHSTNNDGIVEISDNEFLLNRAGRLIRVINDIEIMININVRIRKMLPKSKSDKIELVILTTNDEVMLVSIHPTIITTVIASNITNIHRMLDRYLLLSNDGNVSITTNDVRIQVRLDIQDPLLIRDGLIIDNNGILNEVIINDDVIIRPINTPHSVEDCARYGSTKILLIYNNDAWIRQVYYDNYGSYAQSYRLSLKSGDDIQAKRLLEDKPLIEDVEGRIYYVDDTLDPAECGNVLIRLDIPDIL